MAKLSTPQTEALARIAEMAPAGYSVSLTAAGVKINTAKSLVARDLIEVVGAADLNANSIVRLVAPAPVIEVTAEEVNKAQAIVDVTPVVKSIEPRPTAGRFTVAPVPEKIGSMNPGPTFVERPNTVHGGHTVAQVDSLIADYRRHGLTDDEISERLDTWHLRQNRADRRAQVHARKVANRLDMRQARTPKRRRYVSPEAREQKARDAAFTRNRLDFMAESGIV